MLLESFSSGLGSSIHNQAAGVPRWAVYVHRQPFPGKQFGLGISLRDMFSLGAWEQ